jgi:Tol biopolymer transport system component
LDRLPGIFPDYTSIVIPSNISPLNFFIEEKALEYSVEISSENGKKIRLRQSSPLIKIPEKRWRDLLGNNKGRRLNIDVYTRQDKWYKYATINDTIAPETIDNHLVYRLIGLIYTDGDKLGIYQRNLENFEESVIIENTSVAERPCINCHSFSNNQPGKMSMHIRKALKGTVIYDNGKFTKYNTKTDYTMSPAAYTAWHPNGELIAFSLNTVFVYFTSDENKLVEVADQASDLVLYNLKTNTITTTPKICSDSRENLPNWSPDGKWLYFISTKKTTKDVSTWVNTKYDLLRIPFDPETLTWGDADTLLSSKETGKSITWPIASPDGKYIIFCMIDHSYFSIFDKQSDLYQLDLATRKYYKLDVLNSSSSESFHAWSKNGRWMVFSSKGLDDLSTRPYFAYFDAGGNFHKPFVLPQEDPLFYKRFRWNYNIPVMVDGKVNTDTSGFIDILTEKPVDVKFDTTVNINPVRVKTNYESIYH